MLHSTPARQRFSQSRAPSAMPSARRDPPEIEIPELPPYEPPTAPLSQDHQRKLAHLLNSAERRELDTHLEHAAEILTRSAGQVNERLTDARIRYERNKERRRNRETSEDQNEEDEEADDDADQERLGEFERNAETVTEQMEQHMRMIIDSHTMLRGIHDSVLKVSTEQEQAQAAIATAALLPRQTRGQQRRQRREDSDSEEEESDEEAQDDNAESSQVQEARERAAANPPSRRLKDAIQKEADDWNEMSLTNRYSKHNDYIGFYRMVHDAKFPNNEAPPLPTSSTWFEHLEDPNAGSSQQRASRSRRETSPDDDIAIAREKVSLKCPITLQTFTDPVTSAKCRHTFERTAIEDMIACSGITHVPATGGRRVAAVRCPECSTVNTKEDFHADHVILRRVKRAEEEKARRAEEQEEGESQADSPNHVTLPSDECEPDDVDVDVDMDDAPAPSARVKIERQGSSDNEIESESEDEDINDTGSEGNESEGDESEGDESEGGYSD